MAFWPTEYIFFHTDGLYAVFAHVKKKKCIEWNFHINEGVVMYLRHLPASVSILLQQFL